MAARFAVQSLHEGTVLLDRNDAELVAFKAGLLVEAMMVAAYVRMWGPEEFVEVSSTGVGLGMAQLLVAHGLNVMVSYVFP